MVFILGIKRPAGAPKMEPYIWGYKDDIHLIDVSKTAFELEQASKFLEAIASEGRSILWVGTKKAAQGIIFGMQAKSLIYLSLRIDGLVVPLATIARYVNRSLSFFIMKTFYRNPNSIRIIRKSLIS